jgi:glycosyltransferase involved in cell wall biosynthesis
MDFSGGHHDGMGYHLRRIWRTARAAATIFLSGTGARFVYMPVNAGVGLLYNIVIAFSARVRGKCVILHHHSFSYVDTYDARVAVLLRTVGRGATHIVLCDCMARRLKKLYGEIGKSINIPSAFYSIGNDSHPAKNSVRSNSEVLTLGHLSNLSLEKGLEDCIALHRALRARGESVRLILGGPCLTAEARDVMNRALAEFPDSIVAPGLLDEAKKREFYAKVDVFLFPTRYRIEADPIVVSDAQAAGCAVMAIGRGCVPEHVSDDAGMVVPVGVDFVSAVLEKYPTAADLRSFANTAGPMAQVHHRSLQLAATREFSRLAEEISAR